MRFSILWLCLPCLILVGCGGGGGGNTVANGPDNQLLSGIFLDSAVGGLGYRTESRSGVTDANGRFNYLEGEIVSFFLGGIELGSAVGASELTPLSLVGAASPDDARVQGVADELVRMLLLLQSLDRDRDPDNGIDLGDLNDRMADTRLDLQQTTDELFNREYRRIVNRFQGYYRDAKTAQNHLLASLDLRVSVDLPLSDSIDSNGDGIDDIEIRYQYDAAGHPVQVDEVDPSSGQVNSTTRIEYDTEGNAILIEYTDQLKPDRSFSRQLEYDAFSRLVKAVVFDDSGEQVKLLKNAYDEVGNLIQMDLESSFPQASLIAPFDQYFEFGVIDLAVDVFTDFSVADSLISLGNPVSGFSETPLPVGDLNFDAISGFISADPIESKMTTRTTNEYDELGALVSRISEFTPLFQTSLTPQPTTTRTTETFEDGLLVLLRTEIITGDLITDTHILTFEYAATGELLSCNEIGSLSLRQISTKSCLFALSNTIERNAEGLVSRVERLLREDVPIFGFDQFAAQIIQEFDYDQGRLVETRIDRVLIDGLFEQVRRYSYSENGLLQSEERRELDQLTYRRTCEFSSVELNAIP